MPLHGKQRIKMNNKQLSKYIKNIRKKAIEEQNPSYEKLWNKSLKTNIDIGGEKHDSTGPNKSHVEEASQIGSIGGKRNPNKSFHMTSLGDLTSRSLAQSTGNQKRTSNNYSEETIELVRSVKNKKELGKGSNTNDTVTINPTQKPLTTYN